MLTRNDFVKMEKPRFSRAYTNFRQNHQLRVARMQVMLSEFQENLRRTQERFSSYRGGSLEETVDASIDRDPGYEQGRYVQTPIKGLYGIDYGNYAVVFNTNEGTTTVIQEAGMGKLDPDQLEAQLRHSEIYIPEQHIKDAKQEAESLNSLDDILEEHEKSGADSEQRKAQRRDGYRSNYSPKYRVSTNQHTGAIAFTDGEDVIGVNKDYATKRDEVSQQSGMHKWAADEFHRDA
jgi:hypothetical protein